MSELLWHCGYWYGPQANLDQEELRADPTVPLPPLRLRQWVLKPVAIRPAVYKCDALSSEVATCKQQAADWLRSHMETVAVHLATVDHQWRSRIEDAYYRLESKIYACHDIQWSHEAPRGMAVQLAVVCEYIHTPP